MEIPSHLLPTKIARAEYAIDHHYLEVPPGVTPEMVAEPDFWQHLSQRKLKVHDRIEVVAMDGSFEADLRVMAIDPRGLYSQVRVLSVHRAEGSDKAAAASGRWPDKEGYSVEFDRVQKWRIFRGRDLVAKGFPTEGDAIEALANLKALKPAPKAA